MRTPHHDVDIAVIGASLGGVLAAWRACEAGRRVVLTNEFAWIGGQLTAQGVPPDEHRLIEFGGASESYLAFRRTMR
ncbi:MAG: FAD-dependent oxidoreductase, partial [Rhodocyclaceae bacterium]|nr:FAD-dependent oxidoreductase [Rhodocyclaceae bacterium]